MVFQRAKSQCVSIPTPKAPKNDPPTTTARKTAGKKSKNTPQLPSPEAVAEPPKDKESMSKSKHKAHPEPLNVDECEYVVALLVTVDGRHIFSHSNTFQLGKFLGTPIPSIRNHSYRRYALRSPAIL